MISGLLRNTASTLAIKAGPNNPVVRAMMRILCRPLVLKFENDHIDVSKDARTIRLAAKHFPYALDMAEHFDLYFNQVVPENGGAGLLVDYSGPKLQRYKNGLEFELSSFPEELEVIEEYFHWYKPKPDDLIFDIGAYCGVTAYHLSKCVPGGKVYSFEPDPINFRLLTRNVERHGLKNVTPLPFGISGKTEKAAAVKTQIWIAVSVYVLVAIVRKRLGLQVSLYQILQILSVTLFEKVPILRALEVPDLQSDLVEDRNQLILFSF